MAHWAEIDENSIVTRVLVGDNNDPAGDEGYSWLIENLGGTWIKASYNSKHGKHLTWGSSTIEDENGNTINFEGYIDSGQPHLRYNFPGVGYLYDPIRDAFIPPKPFDSWILNEEICDWEAPTSYPNDGKSYIWNEDIADWEEFIEE